MDRYIHRFEASIQMLGSKRTVVAIQNGATLTNDSSVTDTRASRILLLIDSAANFNAQTERPAINAAVATGRAGFPASAQTYVHRSILATTQD